MLSVTIVTHAGLPGGAPDDLALATALRARGASVRCSVWNDEAEDWSQTDVAVVRSTWDYHRAPQRWLAWLDRVAPVTRVVNPPALMRWNADKRYLLDLANASVPIVPTLVLGRDACLADTALQAGWSDVVLKPTVGASSEGARRFEADAIATQGEGHLAQLLERGSALLQPYQPAVETARERSLVWFGDAFSHAFTKPGFHAGVGGDALRPHEPTVAELDVAAHVLGTLPSRPAIARIDLIRGEDRPMVMEVELIEPQLALHLHPPSAARLASLLSS